MAITKAEVSKTITPNIPDWVSPEDREAILEDVGEYVATETALIVGDGASPVNGYGQFKLLTEDYADKEKGGDRTPNLELEGDLLRSLSYRVEMDSVKVGFFDKDQAIKAYGHNTGMKGHKWLDGVAPVRKLVPDEKEKYIKDIEDGIELIVDARVSALEREQDEGQEEAAESEARTRTRTARARQEALNDWLGDITGISDEEWWL